VGRNLTQTDRGPVDTTPILKGKASVVALYGNAWADNQAATFYGPQHNPSLAALLDASGGLAQCVRVNVEDNALKAFLVMLFKRSIRRQVGAGNWDKYFLVRKGITDEIRECIGFLNSKVGYVYVVDQHCRIRWAGSGVAEPEEREGLVKAVQRVLSEMGHTSGVKQS